MIIIWQFAYDAFSIVYFVLNGVMIREPIYMKYNILDFIWFRQNFTIQFLFCFLLEHVENIDPNNWLSVLHGATRLVLDLWTFKIIQYWFVSWIESEAGQDALRNVQLLGKVALQQQ